MRYNVMEYASEGNGTPWRRTAVVLHGSRADHTQLLPLARQLGRRMRLFAPRSARWVAFGPLRQSYSWFSLPARPCPEPISFGDALFQLEQFLWEVVQADPSMSLPIRERVDLIGYEQGAAIALAMATIWPEMFRAVVSIDGFMPHVPDALSEGAPMNGLPILLLDGAPTRGELALAAMSQADAAELRRRGAKADVECLPAAVQLHEARLARRIAAWLEAQENAAEAEAVRA